MNKYKAGKHVYFMADVEELSGAWPKEGATEAWPCLFTLLRIPALLEEEAEAVARTKDCSLEFVSPVQKLLFASPACAGTVGLRPTMP